MILRNHGIAQGCKVGLLLGSTASRDVVGAGGQSVEVGRQFGPYATGSRRMTGDSTGTTSWPHDALYRLTKADEPRHRCHELRLRRSWQPHHADGQRRGHHQHLRRRHPSGDEWHQELCLRRQRQFHRRHRRRVHHQLRLGRSQPAGQCQQRGDNGRQLYLQWGWAADEEGGRDDYDQCHLGSKLIGDAAGRWTELRQGHGLIGRVTGASVAICASI